MTDKKQDERQSERVADQKCHAVALTPEQLRVQQLERDSYLLHHGGIVEIAVRNRSVMEYIEHWEGRAESAEQRLKELERDVNDLNNVLRAAGWGQGEIDSAAEMLYKAEERASKLVDALRTVQPYFEGEHAYDHPHCVLLRTALADAAPHPQSDGKVNKE